MAKILGINIKNFKALKDVTLGRASFDYTTPELTQFCVVIGKNGVGKSTLFDAFSFISDCLNSTVQEACDKRGGYERIVSAGVKEPISFKIYYRENINERPISYELSLNVTETGRVIVESEVLKQGSQANKGGQPKIFLKLNKGKGYVWTGKTAGEGDEKERKPLKTEGVRLGITFFDDEKENPRIIKFHKFLENWYLSYYTPDAARKRTTSGAQKHLNLDGSNVGNFVQYLGREHPDKLKLVLKNISKKIPDIKKIEAIRTEDDHTVLRFHTKSFKESFIPKQMSDGTLKLFLYLLLLEDPSPPPFVCIEEPENGLYHKLLEILADEFREYSSKNENGSQIFVTTHQPYFLNSMRPEEVWVLSKGEDGFSTLDKASDNQLLVGLYNKEYPLGNLWYSDYIDARH